MDKQQKSQGDFLDIIFANRNKAYGAYELRKNYARRARNAVAGMLIIACSVSSAPLIAGLFVKPQVQYPIHPYDTIQFQPFEQEIETTHQRESDNVQTETSTETVVIPTEIELAENMTETLPHEPDLGDPETDPGGPSDGSGLQGHDSGTGVEGGTGEDPRVVTEVVAEPETIFESYDIPQLPEFPGGEDALSDYLRSNIHYPSDAVKSNTQGKVTIGFVVNKEGEIEDLKVLRGLGFGCDEEALRVIAAMPRWKPGKNNGKPVKVFFNIPIVFELD